MLFDLDKRILINICFAMLLNFVSLLTFKLGLLNAESAIDIFIMPGMILLGFVAYDYRKMMREKVDK